MLDLSAPSKSPLVLVNGNVCGQCSDPVALVRENEESEEEWEHLSIH